MDSQARRTPAFRNAYTTSLPCIGLCTMKVWLRSVPALIALLGLAGASAAAPPQKASAEKETQASPQVCARPVERDAPAEYGLGIEPHGDHGRAGDSDLHPHDTLVGAETGGEIFVPACEMRCEVDGWKIKVLESLTTSNAIIQFIPVPTIYTFGSALWDDFYDIEVAIGTGSDGWCVNFPTAAPDPIIGPVYQRSGLSSYGSMVIAGPLDDGGLSFCAADPMTGEAPIDYLLDVLEDHAHTNTEHLPLHYCGDQDCYSPQYDTDSQHDPGDTSWVYTDASGEEISFDDFWGSNGGGGDSAGPLRGAMPAVIGHPIRQNEAGLEEIGPSPSNGLVVNMFPPGNDGTRPKKHNHWHWHGWFTYHAHPHSH